MSEPSSSDAPFLLVPPEYSEKELLTKEAVDKYEAALRDLNLKEYAHFEPRLKILTKSKSASSTAVHKAMYATSKHS